MILHQYKEHTDQYGRIFSKESSDSPICCQGCRSCRQALQSRLEKCIVCWTIWWSVFVFVFVCVFACLSFSLCLYDNVWVMFHHHHYLVGRWCLPGRVCRQSALMLMLNPVPDYYGGDDHGVDDHDHGVDVYDDDHHHDARPRHHDFWWWQWSKSPW